LIAQATGANVPHRIQRIEGKVMLVNSYVVQGPQGLVVVDGMLTVTDAALVRAAIDETGQPLAGVLITHPHPDHYAGLGELVGQDDVPIVATAAVDAVIRRDDAIKNDIVGPMMGDEWPETRVFPNQLVEDGNEVRLGGLTLTVQEVGPAESHVDTLWRLDERTIFAGDIAYNHMHAYLADGRWEDWLEALARLEVELPADVTLHVGHGPAGGRGLLAAQRRYIETFVTAVGQHADVIEAGDHTAVQAAVQSLVPGEDLLFLADLSIEPVLASLSRDQEH
jgi:glyoxylase-like metal-dependent hydrolase (beta-lactamase superfamily II)